MTKDLLKILACPMCKTTPLRSKASPGMEVLTCPGCSRQYRIDNSIPHMLPEDISSDLTASGGEWSGWNEKLNNFIQWRKLVWNESRAANNFKADVSEINSKFAEFTGVRDSGKKIIDIGCGNGGLRVFLGACRYFGIDPLLVEGCNYDFPMVRGVGEYLPFVNGSFDEAILNQVLDHCNSLDKVVEEAVRVIGENGAVNVMQYLSEPDDLLMSIYQGLLKVYLALKREKSLDSKTRHFDRLGLEIFFRERFEEVKVLKYTKSQIFIKASRWKNRK